MVSFFQRQPFAGTPRRPLLRLVLVCLVFGIFFVIFLPSTDPPHFERPLHISSHHHHQSGRLRPPAFIPPDPESPRRRIKAQRPLAEHGGHRNDDIWADRADAVRAAFLHAYNGYTTHAAPHDELLPLTKASVDKCVLIASRYVSLTRYDTASMDGVSRS